MMDISRVDADNLNVPSIGREVSATHGMGTHAGGDLPSPHGQRGDVYEVNSLRQGLRDMLVEGNAFSHIHEIIDSGIEPDCLRAELALYLALNDNAGISIILDYLAGNFKEAQALIDNLISTSQDGTKIMMMAFISDYLTGKFESAYNEGKAAAEMLSFSPLFCYAYADILLSLGYINPAREYYAKYVDIAKKHLDSFVSDKEKYEEEKRRRNVQKQQLAKEKNSKNKPGDGKQNAEEDRSNKNKDSLAKLRQLFDRRRFLISELEKKDISRDKRPLLYELDDIDIKIGSFNRNK